MNYTIRYVHRVAPSDKDVKTGVSIRDGAFSDRKTLAKALREVGVLAKNARIRTFRVEGDKVLVFPTLPGATTYWHSVVIEAEPPITRAFLEAAPELTPIRGAAERPKGLKWALFDISYSDYVDDCLEKMGLVTLGEPECDNEFHSDSVGFDDWDAALSHISKGGTVVKIRDDQDYPYWRLFAVEPAPSDSAPLGAGG